MSNELPDSPTIIPDRCPVCEPEADPRSYVPRYCEPHFPDRAGADDRIVESTTYLTGSAEATGETNKMWCDLLHRGRN